MALGLASSGVNAQQSPDAVTAMKKWMLWVLMIALLLVAVVFYVGNTDRMAGTVSGKR